MAKLFLILLELGAALGVAPLLVGLWRLRPAQDRQGMPVRLGSVLLCALAFNLTFIWQELWLVIPKALTPGLHPTLYHNDHEWTGAAPTVELLQGTGALATLVSGLVFLGLTAWARRLGLAWRSLLFWLAFQGLFQSLTQLVFGTVLPGNDVGRALDYLHLGLPAKRGLLALAVTGMALAGAGLARVYPTADTERPASLTRTFGLEMLLTTLLAVLVVVPFRVPRNAIEVALVPAFISLFGAGWLVLGAALVRRGGAEATPQRPGWIGPAIALGVLLLVFQLILRPGVAIG